MINNRSKIKNRIGNEAGFTLLEILAVIVILGILGVVAVPKYFNLQAQARDRTMAATGAEAISRVNGFFAESVLGGDAPKDIVYDDDSLGFTGNGLGIDFIATVTSGGGAFTPTDDNPTAPPIKITISVNTADGVNSALAGAPDKEVTVPRPGL